MAPRRCFLIPAAAALLAACASQPVPAPDPSGISPPAAAATAEPAEPRFTPAALDPADPGLIALADAVSGASLVSFGFPGSFSTEENQLKAALTQALVERHGLGVIILDAPCAAASVLDTYIAGAQTADLAADTVRAAGIEPMLQTAELAELMTWLRGWNAVFTDMPVRIAGKDCPLAQTAEPGRMAIFWGYTYSFADTGEKRRALGVRGDLAGGEAVWITQDFSGAAAGAAETSRWAILPARSARPLPGDPQSVDIVVQHPGLTPAPGL
ncbi:erythromycin esterase family protein [Hyphomonas sp.]|uniref:erythromycin esterase family protein n=1 Tax=Hyphomonas sp. TaxID=87 RepID=UPI00391C3A33